jgi:hypothetical protein
METEIQWRNLAKAYYDRFVESMAEQGVEMDGFETLYEHDVNAIIEGLKYTIQLYVAACTA